MSDHDHALIAAAELLLRYGKGGTDIDIGIHDVTADQYRHFHALEAGDEASQWKTAKLLDEPGLTIELTLYNPDQ
jgi:hypothetical protein